MSRTFKDAPHWVVREKLAAMTRRVVHHHEYFGKDVYGMTFSYDEQGRKKYIDGYVYGVDKFSGRSMLIPGLVPVKDYQVIGRYADSCTVDLDGFAHVPAQNHPERWIKDGEDAVPIFAPCIPGWKYLSEGVIYRSMPNRPGKVDKRMYHADRRAMERAELIHARNYANSLDSYERLDEYVDLYSTSRLHDGWWD
jgi:hypothetical protein